jgi:hypothetical protein
MSSTKEIVKKLLNISNENKIGRERKTERKICFANLI